jgi:hypothetical protein
MRFTEVVTTLKTLISEPQLINRIFFASSQQTVPELAYKVNFPRLEVILEGDLYMEWKPGQANINAQNLHAGDVLFVPEKAWNYPHWEKPVTTLSILFGKQQRSATYQYRPPKCGPAWAARGFLSVDGAQ